jgi:methionyl-tRNA formyltransferase
VTDRRVRAFSPKPGAFAREPEESGGRLIKIIEVEPLDAESADAAPGEAVRASEREGMVVAAGEGLVRLVTVQPEGGRAMEAEAYLRGHRLRVGMRLRDGAGDSGGARPSP